MPLKALIFDCDGEGASRGICACMHGASTHSACTGVILLSEDLHRVAYNAAFEHFQVRCNGEGEIANWYGSSS